MCRHFYGHIVLIHFIFSALLLSPPQAIAEEKGKKNVRPSVLAGTWYPGNKDALSQTVKRLLSRAEAQHINGKLMAIIVPHAGYRYSGGVAAYAFKLLQGGKFKRIILIGPSHYMRFKGASVNLQSAYETPLGIVPVDQEMAKKILNADPNIRWLKKAHKSEHCLEIQLPFLQTVLHNFRIVPIIMGQQDYATCSNLANVLAQVMDDNKDTLLLASSDLSHFHAYEQANELDLRFIEQVKRFDPQGLANDLSAGKCEACGGGPVITVLLAAKAMGASQSVILNYANSGDVTGDRSRVVGYVSSALIRTN